MLRHILKKDLLMRKGVNLILLIFITLSTIFLASSVNNILVVNSGVNYFMDYAHVPDLNVVFNTETEKPKVDQWLDQQLENGMLDDYDYNNLLIIPNKSVHIEKETEILSNGATLYLGKMDVDYNQVFDEDGKDFHLNPGEIGLSGHIMDLNNLAIGDVIQLSSGDIKQEFVIKEMMKDAAFGNPMVGMSRFIVNEDDYALFEKSYTKLGLYYIDTMDEKALEREVTDQGFKTLMNQISRDTYAKVYSFDMIIAALLILIGVCLILIALLVLRFTLVFTMEEQFQEIGIMKAIGFRNLSIKQIYLMKYFIIVVAGALLGLILSVPVSQIMIQSISSNVLMESSQANIMVNILCALGIVGLVLCFCYFCTRKLNNVSAITAIRNGQDGERYAKFSRLHLSKRKRMTVSVYLGLNDILSHVRRYAVLIITFCISFILITIPVNTLTTMKSDEMINKFLLNPDSNVYVRGIELSDEIKYTSIGELNQAIDRLKGELEEKGYQNVLMTAVPLYFAKFKDPFSTHKLTILTIQIIGPSQSFVEYKDGSAPQLENEVAFSEMIMDKYDWQIGDIVHLDTGDETKSMIITGTYSDYMQLGLSARLNPKINMEEENMLDYWNIMVDFKTDKSQLELVDVLNKQLPSYEWSDAQYLIDQNIGGIKDSLRAMVLPMTLMLCAVIMLITLLMEKLFITREKSEIAILKSIGFSYRSISVWQMMRMIFVVFTSMIIAVPLSLMSNQFVLKPIFAIMGAEVSIQVDVLQAYIIYPGILLIGILIAARFALRGMKKIEIRDMNNLE